MKKSIVLLVWFTAILLTGSSCNTYYSLRTAKNVQQLSCNSFNQKVARSLIRSISTEVINKGLTSYQGTPLLNSTLGSMFNTPQSESAFKKLLTKKYGIDDDKVNANFDKLQTMRDATAFVAKNGKRFDFNSYSNKLF